MTVDLRIRMERSADADVILEVHREAFGNDEDIPRLVERLRRLDAALPTVSLVAENPVGEVVGHVMLSHSWLDAPDRLIDIFVLSPLGVKTSAQGKGVGTALLDQAVREADAAGAPMVILEGNPKFYGPRGFETCRRFGIGSPSLRIPERALQVVCLTGFAPEMTGTLVYRELWWELDCVGLR